MTNKNHMHHNEANTMKSPTIDYLEAFRDPDIAQHLIREIHQIARPGREYRLMEFCGGHTHTLFRYGIPDTLPDNIKLLHGPGCPVCVLPIARVDAAIALAHRPKVIFCSYGDALRIPGTHQQSLLKAKAEGADVRMVLAASDCLAIAKENPDKQIIFMALGFETTTPPTAVLLDQIIQQGLDNIAIYCNHVLTPPAMQGIMLKQAESKQTLIDGFIGPGHVSLITGSDAFEQVASEHKVPIVIAGFEPLDLLYAMMMLIRQINAGTHIVENQYTRAVNRLGNQKAQALCDRYLETREEFEWRGLGFMPLSALRLKEQYATYDAEGLLSQCKFTGKDNKACECPSVLLGIKTPFECKLFDKPCTPDNPLGSCMVSSEGACAAYYKYHRNKKAGLSA